MNSRLLVFLPSLALVLDTSAFGQQFLNSETIQAQSRQCRIIKSTLDRRAQLRTGNGIAKEMPADDYTAAGLQCEKLEAALRASDESATQQVAHDLYVILA